MEETITSKKKFFKILGRYLTEIVVIFIGITISFMFDEWREGRNNRQKEKEFVRSLITDLKEKKNEIKDDSTGSIRTIQVIDSCFIYFYQSKEPPDELTKDLLSRIQTPQLFSPSTPTYKSSSSTGQWQQLPDSLRRMTYSAYEKHLFLLESYYKRLDELHHELENFIMHETFTTHGYKTLNGTRLKTLDMNALKRKLMNEKFLSTLKGTKASMMAMREIQKMVTNSIDTLIARLQLYQRKIE